MTEGTHRAFDTWIKIVALVGAALGFIWGVHQFKQNAGMQVKLQFLNDKRRVHEEFLDAARKYMEINGTEKKFDYFRVNIQGLHQGKMKVYMDKITEPKITEFVSVASNFQKDGDSPKKDLTTLFVELATACGESNRLSWTEPFRD